MKSAEEKETMDTGGRRQDMEMEYSSTDRVFTKETFQQFEQLNKNTNSRIPIFFCVDVSGSMTTHVGIFKTRIQLLSDVMERLLQKIKSHPILGERAVIGLVTYNSRAVLEQTALDVDVVDIKKITSFQPDGQTRFSRGLRRTLQAIDQYRDSIRQSDVDTFVPIMVFMTDGAPVGDNMDDIADVYNEIRQRILQKDLYVFPIGISKEANMEYINVLSKSQKGYQMINANDFETVFEEIEKLVNEKPTLVVEEEVHQTEMASKNKGTIDSGTGTAFSAEDFTKQILNRH